MFYFVFEGTFQEQAPRAYISRRDLTEGFLHYEFDGLIFGGAFTWRGLFSEFYSILFSENVIVEKKKTSVMNKTYVDTVDNRMIR